MPFPAAISSAFSPAGRRRCARGLALGATLLLGACASVPGIVRDWLPGQGPPTESSLQRWGGKPMPGADVRALLGRPVRYDWETAAGASGRGETDGRGGVRLYWPTGGVNGRMRFKEEGYCTRFLDRPMEPETCFRVYREGDRDLVVFRAWDQRYMGRIRNLKSIPPPR